MKYPILLTTVLALGAGSAWGQLAQPPARSIRRPPAGLAPGGIPKLKLKWAFGLFRRQHHVFAALRGLWQSVRRQR